MTNKMNHKRILLLLCILFHLAVKHAGAVSSAWYVADITPSTTSITIETSGKMRFQTSVSNGNATHKLPALAIGTYQLQFTVNITAAQQAKVAVYNSGGMLLTEQNLIEGINAVTFNSDGGVGTVKIYEAALSLNNPTVIDIDNYTLSALQTEESARVSEKASERVLATKDYELSNHLGNVLAVVSDKKLGVATTSNTTIDYFKADVQSANDYYAFGSMMNGRKYTGDGYRYGFQGQEKDDELKGEGNSCNYTYRMHDPRIGRFFAIDPLTNKYPFFSPYQFSANTPIMAVELEGLESSNDPNNVQSTKSNLPSTLEGVAKLENLNSAKVEEVKNRESAKIEAGLGSVYSGYVGCFETSKVGKVFGDIGSAIGTFVMRSQISWSDTYGGDGPGTRTSVWGLFNTHTWYNSTSNGNGGFLGNATEPNNGLNWWYNLNSGFKVGVTTFKNKLNDSKEGIGFQHPTFIGFGVGKEYNLFRGILTLDVNASAGIEFGKPRMNNYEGKDKIIGYGAALITNINVYITRNFYYTIGTTIHQMQTYDHPKTGYSRESITSVGVHFGFGINLGRNGGSSLLGNVFGNKGGNNKK